MIMHSDCMVRKVVLNLGEEGEAFLHKSPFLVTGHLPSDKITKKIMWLDESLCGSILFDVARCDSMWLDVV